MKKNYTLNFLLTLFVMLCVNINVTSQVRIVKIDPAANEVHIRNYGASAVDISTYWLCNFPSYSQDMTTITSLAPNTTVTVNTALPMNISDGEMGLYFSTSFTSTTALLDYMEWGSGGHTRESIAVAKGIWGTNEFVNTAAPYGYSGDGVETGVTFWGDFNTLSTPQFEEAPISFRIFPNPASSSLNIAIPSLSNKNYEIKVYDILGKVVYSNSLSAVNATINISKWNSGMFLVKLSSEEGDVSLIKRFVKM